MCLCRQVLRFLCVILLASSASFGWAQAADTASQDPVSLPALQTDHPAYPLVIRIDHTALAPLTAGEINQRGPVDMVVLGTHAVGESRARGAISVLLVPDRNEASFDLTFRGRTHSTAVGSNGPALIYCHVARLMGPQALRMNLNTLVRHGVFAGDDGAALASYVADRLADVAEIRRSRQFPYQFLAAYMAAESDVPQKIKAALHKAAEIACGNVPELPGPVVVGLDVSGSMQSPVTGHRGRGATSKMRCVDVAALFAAASRSRSVTLWRVNPLR
jgi:hypothetical protein